MKGKKMKKVKSYKEPDKKESIEILFIEVIKKAFADALAVGTVSDYSQSVVQSQAKSWLNIHNKNFKLICEQAGTESNYILKLYENLQYNYNSGKITKEQLKFGISRLNLKL